MSAKIRLTGQGFLEVTESQAQKYKQIFEDKEIDDDEKFTIDGVSFIKGDIKAVYIREEKLPGSDINDKYLEYYKERDRLLSLNPHDRALQSGWQYFRLFYKGTNQNMEPTDLMKKKFHEVLESFYASNPEWSKPSLRFMSDFLQLDNLDKINEHVARVCMNTDGEELHAIESSKKYKEKRSQTEDVGVQTKDEIKTSDLPW